MKTTLKLIVFVTLFGLVSCKKESQSTLNYIYKDKPDLLTCDIPNKALIKEAIYSFESDITAQYSPKNPDLRRAFASFMATARNKRIPYLEMVSPQTIKIYEAMKNDGTFYNENLLNTNHPVIKCIAKNIKDVGFRTTFNALLVTNSLKENLILPPLREISRNMVVDKYLSAYAALEFYYKGMHDIDLTKVIDKPDPKVDFNKTPKKAPSSGTNRVKAPSDDKGVHGGDGHNH